MTEPLDPHLRRELETVTALVVKALQRVAAESPTKPEPRITAAVLQAAAVALVDGAAHHPPKPTAELFVDPADSFRQLERDPLKRAGLRMDVATACMATLTASGGIADPLALSAALRQTASLVETAAAADVAFYGEARAISAVHAHQPTEDELREAYGPKPPGAS